MPDVAGFEYLTTCFDELGCAKIGANGVVGMDWQDVRAWQSVSNNELSPWALVLLVKMSRAYAGQSNISSDSKIAPPFTMQYTDDDLKINRENVDKKLRGMFGGK